MKKPPRSSKALRGLLAAVFVTLLSPVALAQWQWVDGSGRKVFSDTAPPPSVPEKSILRRPNVAMPSVPVVSGSDAASPDAPPTAATAPAAPAVPQVSGRDTQLEARKREAEAAEAAKQKAENDRIAKARADNCARARTARGVLDSGQRLAVTNAQGERSFMDDAGRATEIARLNGIINSDCGPMPTAQAR